MVERHTRIRASQIASVLPNDLESTNELASAMDGYIPSYDYTTGQFTWVENPIAGVTASEWNQNGFATRTTSTITWTDLTPDYTLSIQPTDTSFDYWIAGVKYTSTGDTVQIDNTKEGIHVIYYDGDTLTSLANPTSGDIDILIRTKCLVSIIYWNTSASEAIYIGEERHGKDMSSLTHNYLHFAEGLRYFTGLGLNTINADGAGDTADAQFGVDLGAVSDEDIYLAISAINSETGLPVYYMLGADAEWQKYTEAGFSVRTLDGTSNDRLAYNQYTGGAWQLTEVPSGDFVLCHVFATTEKDNSMIAVMGQNTYINKINARAGALTEIHSLIVDNILFPEIRAIATVIFQTNTSYSSSVNARIVTTAEGDDYIDWRNEVISRTEISTSDHNSLSGLQGGTSSEYYHLTSADYTELTEWLDNITLGSDGKLTLVSGVAINEFSSDGTLAGDSDDAVPTEKAVKTYCDNLEVDTSVIENNIALNSFRIAINGSLTRFNMIDGVVDEYEDESGIDTGASSNEDYDSVNDLYSPDTLADEEVDYMEYASDETAQAAYVSDDTGGSESVLEQATDTSNQEWLGDVSDNEYRLSQGFQVSANSIITALELRQHSVVGSPSGNWTLRVETDNGGEPSGTLVHANASVVVSPPGNGNTVKGTFASSFSILANTLYWFVLNCDNQSTGVYWGITMSSASVYANGIVNISTNGTWAPRADLDFYFKVYGHIPNLQSYSEDTIKSQGSYSLKGIALITDSLNDTLTRTVSPTVDLSGYDSIKFDIYSSRTGSNIKIGIHDSGGTTTEITPNVLSAGQWQEVVWDISGVSDANKDDIDSIIVTILNADAENTFYIDDMFGAGEIQNMTLISNDTEAESEPTEARLVILEEDVDSITINTDLKAYVSLDDGSNWEQVTLSDEGDFDGSKRILVGSEELTDRSDKTMIYKIETLNNKNCRIHGTFMGWR